MPASKPDSRSNSPLPIADPVAWAAPLLDLVAAVIAQKWVVMGIVLLGAILGVVRLGGLPPEFKASAVAVLLPREKAALDVAIDTSSVETSDDRAERGSAGMLMLPPDPTLYTTLINSRPVLSRLADKYSDRLGGELSPRDRSDEVVSQLRSIIRVSSTEEGLMTVTVECQDPTLAADVANELFAECERASKSIERQLILQQASHLDQALARSVERLQTTERELGAFAETMDLVDIGQQTGNQLRSMRELRSEIDRLGADLGELEVSYSKSSPEVTRVRTRLAVLEEQLAASRSGIVGSVGAADFGSMMVRYESLRQKIRFERDLVATLSTKADIYRLRAEAPTGNLAVIRPATVPDRPSGPSRKRELGIALGVSLILGLGWAIGIAQVSRIMADATLGARVRELVEQLSPRLLRFLPHKQSHPAKGELSA